MITQTHCKEYREGKRGRRRTYRCTECNCKFQVETLEPLPKHNRACQDCKLFTFVYTFLAPDGQKFFIRAGDAELATLRAWHINTKLSFKGGINQ